MNASKFCTRCDRLTDHQTHRHAEAHADQITPGTTVQAVRDGRTYATGTLIKVYDAPTGRMAQIDEGIVSGPADLPTKTIVFAADITEAPR